MNKDAIATAGKTRPVRGTKILGKSCAVICSYTIQSYNYIYILYI